MCRRTSPGTFSVLTLSGGVENRHWQQQDMASFTAETTVAVAMIQTQGNKLSERQS